MLKLLSLGLLALSLLCSCQTAYYKVWEKLGQEKRDLLESQVSKAAKEQGAMEKEFADVLSRIRSEYDFKEGDAESLYDDMKSDYDRIDGRKRALNSRAQKVRRIAKDLFVEWKSEANALKNTTYRKDSLSKLKLAQGRFKVMSCSLGATEKRLETVTGKFKDHVTYLKHNLNAKSLNVFKKEFSSIKIDMETLIASVKKSMKDSDQFKGTLP